MQVEKDVGNDSAVGRHDTSALSCRSASLVNQSLLSNKIDRLDVFEEKIVEALDLTDQFLDYLIRHGVLTQADVAGCVGATGANKSETQRQNRAFLTILKSRLQAAQNGQEKEKEDKLESEQPKQLNRQTSRRLDDSDASASASGYALFINALRYSGQLGLANLLDNEKRIESQFTRLLQTNAQPSAAVEGSAERRRYNGEVSLILQVSAICVNTGEYANWKLLETEKSGTPNGHPAAPDAPLNGDPGAGVQPGTSWIHFSEPPTTGDSSAAGDRAAEPANAKRDAKRRAKDRKRKKPSLLRRLFCGCASRDDAADDAENTARDAPVAPNGDSQRPPSAEVARARAAALLNEKSVEYYHLLCETYHTVLLRYFEQSLKVLVLRIAALPTRCALQVTLIFTQRATLEQFEALFASGALQTALEKRLLVETNACAALKLRALRFTLELDRAEYAQAMAELGD